MHYLHNGQCLAMDKLERTNSWTPNASDNTPPGSETLTYLVSWNNKQAPRWAAADDKFSYSPVFRSQMIERRVRAAIKGPRKGALAELVAAMEEPASQDLRAWGHWRR